MDYIVSIVASWTFFEALLVGVIGAAVLKAASLFYAYISNLIFLRDKFSVSGFWATEFESYIQGKENIEILYIRQNKHEIKFALQQYNNHTDKIRKFRGTGVFRGSSLSCVYYSVESDSPQHGVLALMVMTVQGETMLLGRYAELKMESRQLGIVSSEEKYMLRRVNLGLACRLRLKWGWACFQAHHKAKAALSGVLDKNAELWSEIDKTKGRIVKCG